MKPNFLTWTLDLAAPRSCAVCGRRLGGSQQLLCAACQLHLPFTRFELRPYDNVMARRFWGVLPLERAAALFFYEPRSDASAMVYALKYGDRPDLGHVMGTLLALRMLPHDFFSGVDAIVPVPLSLLRRWHRGYNQSLEIARGIGEVTGLPVFNRVVRRVHFHQSQTQLTHFQRQTNISGAFRLVRPDQVSGRHLLLVDDVVTTGATVTALGQELLRAGDVHLSILSLGFTRS